MNTINVIHPSEALRAEMDKLAVVLVQDPDGPIGYYGFLDQKQRAINGYLDMLAGRTYVPNSVAHFLESTVRACDVSEGQYSAEELRMRLRGIQSVTKALITRINNP